MDIFGSLSYFDCAPASLCTTKLLVMACNFNWFIKITQSFGSGFQIKIVKPEARLIMTDADLDRLSYQIRLGNTFGCEMPTQLFIAYCFFSFLLLVLCLYWLCQWRLTFPEPRYYLISFLFLTQRQHLLLHVVILGPCWPLVFFRFSASSLCWFLQRAYCFENSIVPSRLVSCHRCAVHRLDLLFGVLKGIGQVSRVVVFNWW